jgi:hypothetical protein
MLSELRDFTVANFKALRIETKSVRQQVGTIARREGSKTPAALGHETYKKMRKENLIEIYAHNPGHGFASVLTSEMQQSLNDLKLEREVVVFMTPTLKQLIIDNTDNSFKQICPLVHVNSEEYRWLWSPDEDVPLHLRKKPDGYGTYLPCIIPKPARNDQCQSTESDEHLYGPLANTSLIDQGCVRFVLEAKVGMRVTTEDFGILVDYLSRIGGTCRGMVYAKGDFWLLESRCGNGTKLVQCDWTCKGSAGLIKEFFRGLSRPPPVIELLCAVCEKHALKPYCSFENPSFIGSGAYGYVFAVQDASSALSAVKVVVCEDISSVVAEFDRLVKANKRDVSGVVKVVQDSLCILPGGCCYRMELLGSPLETRNRKWCVKAFTALFMLHLAGIEHGDPRIPNLLQRLKRKNNNYNIPTARSSIRNDGINDNDVNASVDVVVESDEDEDDEDDEEYVGTVRTPKRPDPELVWIDFRGSVDHAELNRLDSEKLHRFQRDANVLAASFMRVKACDIDLLYPDVSKAVHEYHVTGEYAKNSSMALANAVWKAYAKFTTVDDTISTSLN